MPVSLLMENISACFTNFQIYTEKIVRVFHSSSIRMMRFSTKILVLLLSIIIPFSYCAPGNRTCSGLFYNCGSLQGIGYPFWGGDRPQECAGTDELLLQCVENQTVIEFNNVQKFRVSGINQSFNRVSIARYDLWENVCLKSFANTTSLANGLVYIDDLASSNLYIFYGCPSEVIRSSRFRSNVSCTIDGTSSEVLFGLDSLGEGCNTSVEVPVSSTAYLDLYSGKTTLKEAVKQGFTVSYSQIMHPCSICENSGGSCGRYLDVDIGVFCSCQNGLHNLGSCPKGYYHPDSHRKIVALTTGTSASGLAIIICLVILVIWYRKLLNKRSKQNMNLEAAIKQYESIAPKRYSYSDIKKMTNSFKDKLGKGGYGDVYKGNLFDNRPIAVKVLNTSKGSGEDFVNEVASISRTSHVNVVTLLGFCLEGQKRALIYEFMPNGSLERYVHAEKASVIDGHLGWEKLYQIAQGIARGLEYLHRGCTTRIVHFDIKPHNILLDQDFCPKISDFGLSKLCTRKESIISIIEARGTIGYIAPEVVSKNFGDVSHKSDVYSYGMMLLEMVGGRKNVCIEVSNTSKIYFPRWVYQHLVLDAELKLQDAMTLEEDEIARKMILVGLWCIQTDPSQRPAVSKVIDMLEGSLQALEIPPKPFFGSPSTSPENSSTAIAVS